MLSFIRNEKEIFEENEEFVIEDDVFADEVDVPFVDLTGNDTTDDESEEEIFLQQPVRENAEIMPQQPLREATREEDLVPEIIVIEDDGGENGNPPPQNINNIPIIIETDESSAEPESESDPTVSSNQIRRTASRKRTQTIYPEYRAYNGNTEIWEQELMDDPIKFNSEIGHFCALASSMDPYDALKKDFLSNDYLEPKSYKEAIESPESEQWIEAIEREKQSLLEMHTFDIVDRPKNKQVIQSKYVFRVKTNQFGAIERYKARICAKGYSQTHGIDYNETFAPVLRPESLRFMIAYAASQNQKIYNLDVETAFLNGDLEEEVYMEIPEGFEPRGDKVWLLKKSLYGLKQSPRNWNTKFSSIIKTAGFVESKVDPCIFLRYDQNGLQQVLGIFVDDVLGCGQGFQETKKVLMQKLKIKDLGLLEVIVGVTVEQKEKCISLNQTKYLRSVLEKFGMLDCKPISTPFPAKLEYDSAEALTPFTSVELYQQGIGSLIYLSNITRPDITYCVNQLARKLVQPSLYDWKLFKRVLQYLQGTSEVKLSYNKTEFEIQAYSDSSYAEEGGRKSMSGYVFSINGGAIAWKSQRQSIVALSTMEAEYIGLANAMKEGKWLLFLLKEFFPNKSCLPLPIFEDNQSCIKLAQNPIVNDRSKHIDVRLHFIRDDLKKGIFKVLYIDSRYQLADIMTKSLQRPLHERFRSAMGVK